MLYSSDANYLTTRIGDWMLVRDENQRDAGALWMRPFHRWKYYFNHVGGRKWKSAKTYLHDTSTLRPTNDAKKTWSWKECVDKRSFILQSVPCKVAGTAVDRQTLLSALSMGFVWYEWRFSAPEWSLIHAHPPPQEWRLHRPPRSRGRV